MRAKWFIATVVCLMVLLAVLPAHASGTPVPGQSVAGVTLYAPKTYSSCPTTTTSDRLYTTGATSAHRLKGQVIVEYVVGFSRILIQKYFINQTGNLNLQVS